MVARALTTAGGLLLAYTGEILAEARDLASGRQFEWEAVYTGELWRNASGGLRTGERYLANLDLTFSWDLDARFGWPEATLFGYVLYNNSATLSGDLVGDAQTVSNIDAPEALRLYEFWYEQALSDGLDLRAGLYDLNSEFDVIHASRLFLNSSHGIGPDFSQTGENGPSIFPVTSLAARLNWSAGRWTVRAALLDAVPGDPDDPRKTTIRLDDGALSVLEVEMTPFGSTRFAAGYWRYSRRAATLDETLEPGRVTSDGLYALAETTLFEAADTGEGLSVFARYGIAEDRAHQFDRYLGAGLVYVGLLPNRPNDLLGLAWARAENGEPYRRLQRTAGQPVDAHETAWELTYRLELTPWLTLQPDVQYVVDPGTDPAVGDALVFGLRFEVAIGG